MEFKVNNKALEKLLSKTFPAVPTRTPTPILENFLFDINDGLLTVTATDGEIVIRSSINVAADENIKIVVPARLLYDVVKSLGDAQIHFKIEGSKLNLATDKGSYNLSYSSSDDFPVIPEVSKQKEISLSGSEIKKAIDQTSFAISKEDMRPAMTGTLMEFAEDGLRFVTTDGHRLVKYINKSITSKEEFQYILPERAVTVLSKQIPAESDIKIFFSKTNILVQFSDIDFISRLIGDKYPSYNSVIPLENESTLKIKANELHETVKRMMLFSTSTSKQVKLSIGRNNLEVSAEDIDLGSNAKETVECEYDGEAMDIGFNTFYLNDVLSHINKNDVIFKLHSPTRACIIEPAENDKDEDLMLLLMPVRLNN